MSDEQYTVLARRWRPKQFDEVVGQGHVTRTLKNAITSNRIAHAYLLVGPRGVGKTTIARILAKALNCAKGPTPEPCDACDSCREVADGSSLDVIEFDAASNTQVDTIRNLIIDRVAYAPARGPFKIYIVDEVHMLSTSSFNALLKTLEEPPPHVKFIFATTDPQKMPVTVVSRCQRFDLRRISTRDIIGHLAKIAAAEKIAIDDDALLAIARGAEGGLRDAESALDQLISFRGKTIGEDDILSIFGLVSRRRLEELAGAVLQHDIGAVLAAVADLDENGKNLQRVVIELLDHFRNVMAVQCAGEKTSVLDVSEGQMATLRAHASACDTGRLLRIAEILIEAEGSLRDAISKRTLLETSLIRCARAAASVSVEYVLREIAALKSALGLGPGAGTAPAAAVIGGPSGVPPARAAIAPSRPAAAAAPPRGDAPAPAAAADPAGDLELLRAKWEEIGRRIGTVISKMTSVWPNTRPLAVTAAAVEIGLERRAASDLALLDTPRHREAIQKSLQRYLSRPVVATFSLIETGGDAGPAPVRPPPEPVAESPAPAPPPPQASKDAPPDAPRRNVRKELMEQHHVKNLIDSFGGRITDIHG